MMGDRTFYPKGYSILGDIIFVTPAPMYKVDDLYACNHNPMS